MYDGIKIQDLSVSADLLLTHDRLLFALPIDEQTGAILDRNRTAQDRGIKFMLIPRLTGGYRVEIKGSLHKFHNNGLHNANDFTANDLITALDQFVTTYGVNPFSSKLNNVEFGVNIRLPFPVTRVLNNLVSYKNKPFTLDTYSSTPYYQCVTQRYVVKLYDKGHQFNLGENLLRVEVKVLRMEYFKKTGVRLDTLTDLLTVANYSILGTLLVDTFIEILFDDPTINPATLTAKERDVYQNGRNPKFWHIPDDLTPRQANTYRHRLQRTERKYRALIEKHQKGENWQTLTAGLIRQKWEQLTTVNDDLLTRINERRAVWYTLTKLNISPLAESPTQSDKPVTELEKCPVLTDPQKPEMSRFNPLYLELKQDIPFIPTNTQPGAVICPITGVSIPSTPKVGRGVRRFVSAKMLRNNDDLLMRLNSRFDQYAKGSKEDDYNRAAHNVRNTHSNPRNNLKRAVLKIYREPTLFDVSSTLRLPADKRALLDHWQGTPWEVRLG
ncbi:hypothetical protein [Spirosoma fluviale]|uniref:Uncharacterized protein n=1 Tax=Spirosoma fluviale TaxID=1597977 RepID=A0A286GMT8_9BACT|nr:hypothetical protein [Spirosoma fluviale]SOD96399.1 hypothetical protein SAMN06269250_5289 [Spirosoma fluviale]